MAHVWEYGAHMDLGFFLMVREMVPVLSMFLTYSHPFPEALAPSELRMSLKSSPMQNKGWENLFHLHSECSRLKWMISTGSFNNCYNVDLNRVK